MRFLGLIADGIGPEVNATAETVLAEINQKFELNIKLEHDTVDFKSVDKHGVTIRPKMSGRVKPELNLDIVRETAECF